MFFSSVCAVSHWRNEYWSQFALKKRAGQKTKSGNSLTQFQMRPLGIWLCCSTVGKKYIRKQSRHTSHCSAWLVVFCLVFFVAYLCCSMAKEIKLQGTVLQAFVWLSLSGMWTMVASSFCHSCLDYNYVMFFISFSAEEFFNWKTSSEAWEC